MKVLKFVLAIVVSLLLAACVATRKDPTVTAAKTTYYAQAITVEQTRDFTAALSDFGGGAPEALGAEFSRELEAGLRKDVPDLMQGQSPAMVSVKLTGINKGPSLFESPVTTIDGIITITDAVTGATVTQLAIQSNDREQRDKMNSNPLAGLAATVMLKAVLPTQNLTLFHLAKVMRRDIRVKLGGSSWY